MTLLEFYRALLPEEGFFSIFSVPRKKHVWADNLERLAELTGRANAEHSWYFATAAFASKSRLQSEVLGKKCFYLDIDCGPEKHEKDPDHTYPTFEDGLRALVEFAKATKLVPSFIVSSGAGIHAYYALYDAVSPSEWKLRAEKLGELALQCGLKVDSSCTTDSARVLRPLGALHKNGNRVALVRNTGRCWSIEELDEILGEVEEVVAPQRERQRRDVNSELFESIPYSAVKAAGQCAALAEVAGVRGDVPEPQWRAMLGVVRFSVEGEDLAHEWSRGHPDYDDRETQRKYDKWEGSGPTTCKTFSRVSAKCAECEYNGRVTSPAQLGWLTNREVEKLPEEQRPENPPVEAPKELHLPFPDLGPDFRVQKNDQGRWRIEYMKYIETETPDGGKVKLKKWEILTEDAFFVTDWAEAGSGEYEGSVAVIRLQRNGHAQHFEMPTQVLGQASSTRQFLSSKSITPFDTSAELQNKLWSYVTRQYNRAKAMLSPRPIIRDRFGLQFDASTGQPELVSAFGKYVLRGDGTIQESMLGPRLRESANMFTVPHLPETAEGRWDASVWGQYVFPAARKQAEFLHKWYSDEGYRPAQLAIMLSISSPLLVFTAASNFHAGSDLPAFGLTVSLYSSGSGKGKTSLQKVCAAAYGNESAHVRGGTAQDATVNAQFGRAGMLGTMPFFADEVTGNTPVEAATMINRIAMGHDKGRMEKNGNLRKSYNWSFIGLVSTNIPQRELIANVQRTSDALQMRLIEINCDGFINTEQAGSSKHIEWDNDFREMMSANAGALGAVLNYAILRIGQEKVQALVDKCMRDAIALVPGSAQRERFMQRGLACVLAATKIFEATRIPLFDRGVLVEEYAKAMNSAIEFTKMMNKPMLDLLRDMISDFAPHIIVTQNESHKKNDGRMDTVINEHHLAKEIYGRRVLSSNTLYLLVDKVKQWAAEHQCSYAELLRAADSVGARIPVACENGKYKMSARITLTKGTKLSLVWGSVYMFDESALRTEMADGTESDNVIDLPMRVVDPVESETAEAAQSPT